VVIRVHEVWQEDGDDAVAISMSLAGERDTTRSSTARLLHTFEAGSYFEAMTIFYKLMGWGEYKPDPSWGDGPHKLYSP
jgi:hypothetical protein